MAENPLIDPATLKAFENTAAGHDGVLANASGSLLIKPCTKAEIDFYETTMAEHPDFAELMPTFMGMLQLGATPQVTDAKAASEIADFTKSVGDKQSRHKIATEIAIVLENLEYGFKRPNVLDIKLGTKLYAPGTKSDKAERLDKVAAETTSSSLGFRISGMRVWNGNEFDVYDKQYGRKFTAENVSDGFATFFSGLSASLKAEDVQALLETMLAEIVKIRHGLERYESRMYSSSILIVYEGDSEAINVLIGREPDPLGDERAPTNGEVAQAEEEDELEDDPPVAYKVRLIDFAHAEWTPGKGQDENMIVGLKNVEKQMDQLIARFE